MSIEWKEGAICYAGGFQFKTWDVSRGELITVDNVSIFDFETVLSFKDFQLNIISQGDYIPASELDTDQEYNDAIEVFELFGFEAYLNCGSDKFGFIKAARNKGFGLIVDDEEDLVIDYRDYRDEKTKKRKVTFNQLMAIGKLKRMMNERDNATLNSNEETELKSRAMASELNSELNDEWPKVGGEAITTSSSLVDILAIDGSTAWVRYKNKTNIYNSLPIARLSKPKSKEDLLIEELQTKLVENNSVDSWMLAANIINGDIEGLTYKGDSDD